MEDEIAVPFRGFIAVDVPSTEPLEALVQELRTSGAPLKLVDVRRIHLTLKFLGDTEEGLVPEIMEVVRAAAEGVPPFRIHLLGTGAFPSLSRMNVVWIGVAGAEPLSRIAGVLDGQLGSLGFRREGRAWSPHATIARVKGGRNLDRVRQILRAHEGDSFGEHEVARIILKKSDLRPTGAEYSDIESVDLVRG